MLYMGRLAREAARDARACRDRGTRTRTRELWPSGSRRAPAKILEANEQDIEAARGKGRDDAFLDRLTLERGAGRGDGDRACARSRRLPIRSAR